MLAQKVLCAGLCRVSFFSALFNVLSHSLRLTLQFKLNGVSSVLSNYVFFNRCQAYLRDA